MVAGLFANWFPPLVLWLLERYVLIHLHRSAIAGSLGEQRMEETARQWQEQEPGARFRLICLRQPAGRKPPVGLSS